MNSPIRSLWASLCLLLFTVSAVAAEPPRVRLTTNVGDIVLELNAEKAPLTVNNFLNYVDDGFYEGTIFHRVIDGFMIQGGGWTEDMTRKKPNSPIKNEADNGLKNESGTVAMARTSDPHSATAQFFINVNNNEFLNHRDKSIRGWGYAVFGKVVEGQDVVDKIRTIETGARAPMRKDVPLTPIKILKAARLTSPDNQDAEKTKDGEKN
ncbi:MAG: peptidylprolyl isomerase [Pseudomonadota bacterium]